MNDKSRRDGRTIARSLEQLGYDGLYCTDCDCSTDTVILCNSLKYECRPGYRYHCDRCYKGPLLFGTCDKATQAGWMIRCTDWCEPVYVDADLYDQFFKNALLELDSTFPPSLISKKTPAALEDMAVVVAMQNLAAFIAECASEDAGFHEKEVCQFAANKMATMSTKKSGKIPGQSKTSPWFQT